MNMTHYMELLATNQPWNLLIFMAVPIVLAETIAVTELYLLYTHNYDGAVRKLNRVAASSSGFTFSAEPHELVRDLCVALRASYAEETDAVVRYLVKVRRPKPEQIAVFAQQDSYGDAGFAGVAKAMRSLRGGDEGTILRLNYKRNTAVNRAA
jgi:hypothetical protein